jgi:hypothetical protein
MTSDVGPLIQQCTTGSALSHLRSFVAGIHDELDQVRRFLVDVESAPASACARAVRLAAQQRSGGAEAADTTAAPVSREGVAEQTAATTSESGEGEESFSRPEQACRILPPLWTSISSWRLERNDIKEKMYVIFYIAAGNLSLILK